MLTDLPSICVFFNRIDFCGSPLQLSDAQAVVLHQGVKLIVQCLLTQLLFIFL